MLEVEGINVSYGDVLVLVDVSFKVNEGEVVTIIGSNGSGKTTILNTVSGLLHSAKGSIKFLGSDIARLGPHQIVEAGVSQVPEGRGIFPQMTVLENLELGSYCRRAKKSRRDSLQRVFNLFPVLEERRSQVAGTMSGGEQQMLALGRGLMSKPKLLMLDEPSSGLAPVLVQQMFEFVERIKREEGISILLVEQHVHHALKVSGRGYVLENGQISLEGESDQLVANEYLRKAYLGL